MCVHVSVSSAVCAIQWSVFRHLGPFYKLFRCRSDALSELSLKCILLLIQVYSRQSDLIQDFMMPIIFGSMHSDCGQCVD